MKICVIAATYSLSGVPLAQLKLAKAFSKEGHSVELIYGDLVKDNKLPKSSNFEVRCLFKKRVSRMFFDFYRILKKNNYDIIFSAGDHLNIVVLISSFLARSKAKISCSSRVTPYDVYSNNFFSKGFVMKILMKLFMNKANVLSCVSKDMVSQYQRVLGSKKHICIYNIVKDGDSMNLMFEKTNHKWLNEKKEPVIIAAGMLEKWKGFEDLILAFNMLLKKKKVKLIILGNGSLRYQLLSLIKKLQISEHVELKGYVENPLKYFRKADIFALSSHVEGMPNVLIEAMMAGCTPVATDCQTGPREILKSEDYGYLVEVGNPNSMYLGLLKALEKPITQEKLSEVVNNFSEKIIIKKHLSYLK